MAANITNQISAHLIQTKALHPTQAWLASFLESQRPTTPVPVLCQTALFRLQASDITASLIASPSSCFPTDVLNANIKERHIAGPIVTQVLAVEDMSKSRWEQIEAIEALERGEGTKGREIIRVAPAEDGDNAESRTSKSGGPHKLLLQDAKGARMFGIELKEVDGVGLGMNIGCKMILRNVLVARGVLMLEPGTSIILGGKIDSLHKAWKEGRKEELKKAIEASEQASRR